jgi:hypothetical protein
LALVHAIGVRERSIGEDRAERVEFAVELLDPSKCQFDQLARGRLATPHELGLSGHTVERHVGLEHRPPTLSGPTMRVNDAYGRASAVGAARSRSREAPAGRRLCAGCCRVPVSA